MSDEICNRIEIGCTPEELFAYVTQPWRWHEWHPNSKSARAAVDELAEGDTFDEVIELQPLSPLPLTLRKETHYRVVASQPARSWQVAGEMAGGRLQIRYQLEPVAAGTRFTRTLCYETRGINRLLAPLLRPRMRRMSLLALQNLKAKLEAAG